MLAVLYAFVFFMAGIFPALLFPADRAQFFGSFVQWGPGVIRIVVALVVAHWLLTGQFVFPAARQMAEA